MSGRPGADGLAPQSQMPGRGTLLLLAAGLVPWVLIPYETGVSLVFSFGLVTPHPLYFQSVLAYLDAAGRLPRTLLAYPIATVLYASALASRALAALDREDRRVTAGLLGLAGLDVLYFAVAFSSYRIRVVALPTGTFLLWLAAWACRPDDWLREPA